MKIDSSIGKLVATPQNEGKVTRNAPSPQSAARTESRDEVKLTPSGQLLASGGPNEGTPMDSAKVEAIKQAISEGRFKINPEKIADGLLSSVRDLLASQKS